MTTLKDLTDQELLQYHKLLNDLNKRHITTREHGYDLKFAYHLVRLLNECEQILIEGDLDLQRNREQLKSIRRGEWTNKEVIQYFSDKERQLEELYTKSELPHSPDVDKIRALLFECLEMHYDFSDPIVESVSATNKLDAIRAILDRHVR